MENYDCQNCKAEQSSATPEKTARRKFLQGAAAAAGGLVLGLQVTRAEGETAVRSTPNAAPSPETLFTLPPKVLEAVGGFEVVENGDDKIIVARTGPTSIVACSAVCTHKGGILEYDHAGGQFVCRSHGARFETTGKVAKGPAKKDLKSYQTRAVLGISAPVEEPK